MNKIIIFLMVSFLWGCSANKSPPKESDEQGVKIFVVVVGNEEINKDINGRASPLRLDFFQLTDNFKFDQKDYFALTSENVKEELTDHLIKKHSYSVHPNEYLEFNLRTDTNFKNLGVVARLRENDIKTWKLSLVKQKLKWYHFGAKYLYLLVTKDGISQITKKELKLIKQEMQDKSAKGKETIQKSGQKFPNEGKTNTEKGILIEALP